MSPGDFKRAWDARNERHRVGGVFDRRNELWERLGQAGIDSMTPSELIAAVRDLPEKPDDEPLTTPEGAGFDRSAMARPTP
jgi:hypothetical protein